VLQAEAPERTRQGYEATVGINHLGHFLLAELLQPRLAADGGGVLVVTASGVHDPESPGGTVAGDPATGATLGDLSGLGAVAGGAVMADGAMTYNGAKAYHDSKLCNVLFAREADRRWGAAGVSVRSFNPGLITDTGLFRAARKDNLVGTLLFSFVATNLAGFSVPVEVGGARLAYAATASEAEVPSGSYLSAPAATSKAATRAEGDAPRG
jgi:protochlorophyllide reductase